MQSLNQGAAREQSLNFMAARRQAGAESLASVMFNARTKASYDEQKRHGYRRPSHDSEQVHDGMATFGGKTRIVGEQFPLLDGQRKIVLG